LPDAVVAFTFSDITDEVPVHTGVVPLIEVKVGVACMFTAIESVAVQPLSVTFTLYKPRIAAVVVVMVGFCTADVKLAGPVHE
jgi:hypothetical protein